MNPSQNIVLFFLIKIFTKNTFVFQLLCIVKTYIIMQFCLGCMRCKSKSQLHNRNSIFLFSWDILIFKNFTRFFVFLQYGSIKEKTHKKKEERNQNKSTISFRKKKENLKFSLQKQTYDGRKGK